MYFLAVALEVQPAVEVAEQQQAEQMRVFWQVCRWSSSPSLDYPNRAHSGYQYISGMLTNLGTMPLARIQGMLKFVAPNYDRTQDQLLVFMEAAKREGLVDLNKDGLWRLTK